MREHRPSNSDCTEQPLIRPSLGAVATAGAGVSGTVEVAELPSVEMLPPTPVV